MRLFRKVASGSQAASEVRLPLDDPSLPGLLGGEAHAALVEDAQLLDELGAGLDLAAVWRGELTPVFFGSAVRPREGGGEREVQGGVVGSDGNGALTQQHPPRPPIARLQANNFGVQAFLDSFLQYAAVPRSMPLLAAAGASGGAAASQAPTSEHFSGFVFVRVRCRGRPLRPFTR